MSTAPRERRHALDARRGFVADIRFLVAGLAALLLLPAGVARASEPTALDSTALEPTALEPTGFWWAEGGFAKVEIRHCDDGLCGEIVWLRHPWDLDGCELRDEENPHSELRTRALVGLQVLRGLRRNPDDPAEWKDGDVYDPSSGRTYRAVLTMEDPDRLRLRGYIGIRLLGRTTIWIRVGSEGQCREPE